MPISLHMVDNKFLHYTFLVHSRKIQTLLLSFTRSLPPRYLFFDHPITGRHADMTDVNGYIVPEDSTCILA